MSGIREIGPALLAAILLLAVAAGCTVLPPVDAGPAIAGRYEDLTQADWPLAVELKPGGKAVLEYAWWDAQRGTTRTRRRAARWEEHDGRVLLHYEGVTDTLAPRRSLRDDAGRSRGAGFEVVEPIDRRSVVGGSRLWKTDPR